MASGKVKCADENCLRPALPGQDYCSSICAPKGTRPALKPTRSVLTVSSFTAGDGAPLEESENDNDETENEQSENEEFEQHEQGSGTTGSEKKNSNVSAWHREGSTGAIPKKADEATMNAKQEKTLPARSEDLPLSSDEVTSESTNLIDDSLRYLHGLIKSVRTGLGVDSNAKIDPQMINAACNCAKQMSSLLKLKVEVLKAMKAEAK